MNSYKKNQSIKLALLLAALGIVAASFWYSNNVVRNIAKEEKAKIEQIARTFKQINIVEDDEYRSFLIDIIRNNNSVPVILTDQKHQKGLVGNIKGHRNVIDLDRERYKTDSIYKLKTDKTLEESLAHMEQIHERIEIKIIEDFDYIYYDDSILLKQLRYYPFVQLTIIGLFLLISYLTFNSARKAEQNQVWVGMAKETAHQLGTPISSLIGWVEYFKSMDKKDEAAEQVMPEIEKDIGRLEQVAERFSKIGSSPELEKQDLSLVVERTIEYFKKRSPRHISIEMICDKQAIADINAPLFSWVLENLISNALNAIKEQQGYVKIIIDQDNGLAIIDVQDSGSGITKSQFNNVFKPGYTTRKRGWGLGLSLSKRIIESYHSGKIYIKESQLGKGTRFRIELKPS